MYTETHPTASMDCQIKCQKIVDETISWTDYVDKRCMEYKLVAWCLERVFSREYERSPWSTGPWLLLGGGRDKDEEEERGCVRTPVSSSSPTSSSSSSSSEYPLSALNEASDTSEEPLYSWMASWRDHSWHSRDMSSWRRPTWSTRTQNICSDRQRLYNEWVSSERKFIFDLRNSFTK